VEERKEVEGGKRREGVMARLEGGRRGGSYGEAGGREGVKVRLERGG
jgi:hypothetical protein